MLKLSVIAIVTYLLTACASPPQVAVPQVHGDAVKRTARIAIVVPERKKSSCAEATALVEWLRFMVRIETLNALELAGERDRVFVEHQEQPSDGNRLALGYLLSRPQPLVRDVDKSRMFLAEIDSSGAYAPVRDLLLREQMMIDEIADLHAQVAHLQSQLEALKAIETDLTENQKELEDVPQ